MMNQCWSVSSRWLLWAAIIVLFAFITPETPASSAEFHSSSPAQVVPGAGPALTAGRYDLKLTGPDGRKRTAILFVPSRPTPAGGWPLVMMIHGAGGSAANVIEKMNWKDYGDRKAFVTLFPNGTPKDEIRPESFRNNPQTWNSGSAKSLAAGEESANAKGIDDVGFLAALLSDVFGKLPIDRQRVFVTGHSNGSGMAYRFASVHPELVSAIGVCAGHFFQDPKPLVIPVPLIQIIGDQDPFTPLYGGKAGIFGRTSEAPPALKAPTDWATMQGFASAPYLLLDDPRQRILYWGPYPPRAGAPCVESIILKNHGHNWPNRDGKGLPGLLVGPSVDFFDATETMWEFFKSHPRLVSSASMLVNTESVQER